MEIKDKEDAVIALNVLHQNHNVIELTPTATGRFDYKIKLNDVTSISEVGSHSFVRTAKNAMAFILPELDTGFEGGNFYEFHLSRDQASRLLGAGVKVPNQELIEAKFASMATAK